MALVFLVDSVVWIILLPYLSSIGESSQVLNFGSSVLHGMNVLFLIVE